MPDIDYAAMTNEELSTSLLLLANPFTGANMPDSDRDLLAEAARRLNPITTKGTTMTNLDIAKDLAWKLLDDMGGSSAAEHDDYFWEPEGWGAAWDITMDCTFPGSLDSPPEYHTSGWIRLTDPDGVEFTFRVDGPEGWVDIVLDTETV